MSIATIPHTLAWAVRLLARYTADGMSPNAGSNGEFRPPANRGTPPAWGTADRKAPAVCGAFGPSDPTAEPWRREPAPTGSGGDSSGKAASTHEIRHLAGEAGCLGSEPVGGRKSPS